MYGAGHTFEGWPGTRPRGCSRRSSVVPDILKQQVLRHFEHRDTDRRVLEEGDGQPHGRPHHAAVRQACVSLVVGGNDDPGTLGFQLIVELAGNVEGTLDDSVGGNDVGQQLLVGPEVVPGFDGSRSAKLTQGAPDQRMRPLCGLPAAPEGTPDAGLPQRLRPRRRRQRSTLLTPRHLVAWERLKQGFLWRSPSDRQLLPMAPGRPRHVQKGADPSHVAA